MPDLDNSSAAVLISERISDLRETMNSRFDDVDKRFDGIDNRLERVESHVRETNGRVTVLEKARERAQGVIFAYRWVPIALTIILSSGLTILVMALSGNIH